MKNNKKGFISITIIYSFFILFITILLLIMYSYINDRKMNNKIKSDLLSTLRDKSPDISLSEYGSTSPHPSYNIRILILDGGNGISSAKYTWSPNPLDEPTTDLLSNDETVTTPVDAGYYHLIVKACDANNHCKTTISNFFQVGTTYLCIKANTLHNESCENTDEDGHCIGYGYGLNNIISYGNFGNNYEETLGQAYDCDVNGDGTYDPATERFYYLGDYYDPISKTYDTENASLIYYTNVHNGTPNSTYTCAYSTGSAMTPATAYNELPTTSQWSNINLISESRDIMATNGYDHLTRIYNYTGQAQTFIANYTGVYKIELWGAQGGSGEYMSGGKGAYTSGLIELTKDDVLYVYVGGESTSGTGGYNGGGNGSGNNQFFGGGGATDVRLVNGDWDNAESLASRIMVAAGGGGSYYYNGTYKAGGGGGGSYLGLPGGATRATPAQGGTQIAGGTGYNNNATYNGSFAIGGNGAASLGTGGGGGYFGGGGTYNIDYSGQGGAGGSSYVSGLVGTVAIKAADDLSPKLDANNEVCTYPTTDIECSYHYSGKIFTEGQMIDADGREWIFGVDPDTGSFDVNIGEQVGTPTYDGTTTMIGNEGNGFAKITYIPAYNSSPTVDNAFAYTNKAARLLTYQELKQCIDLTTYTGTTAVQINVFDKCNFLFENTKFASSSKVEGYFLESYYPDQNTVWVYDASKNAVYSGVSKTTSNKYGVRPVIEIPKVRIQFN